MRGWLLVGVMVAGCAAPSRPPAAPAPPPPAPSTRAEAEPWTPPPKPRVAAGELDRMRVVIDGEPLGPRRIGSLGDGPPKRSDLWDPCVRELVQTRERAVRDQLGDALTTYAVSCDRAAQRVTFGPPRSRAYATQSHLGIAGVVTRTSARLELVVMRRGAVLPERVTILAGRTRWTSPSLEPIYDAVAEQSTASMPYTHAAARAIQAVLDTDDAILRFEAAGGSEDVAITLDMKQDLRVLADLADALSP